MFQESVVALQLVCLARILVKVVVVEYRMYFLTGCCHKLRMSWEATGFTFFAGVMYKVGNVIHTYMYHSAGCDLKI